jgi:hypothetical protein
MLQARAMGYCLVMLTAFLWWARTGLPGLPGVWWGLFVFFGMRAAQSLPRALMKMELLGAGGGSSTERAAAQPA